MLALGDLAGTSWSCSAENILQGRRGDLARPHAELARLFVLRYLQDRAHLDGPATHLIGNAIPFARSEADVVNQAFTFGDHPERGCILAPGTLFLPDDQDIAGIVGDLEAKGGITPRVGVLPDILGRA